MAAASQGPPVARRPGYATPANDGVGHRGLCTREQILASAAKAFLRNGFHSTSLDMIAKAANVSRATVYQYFANKEDIFLALSKAASRDVLSLGGRLGRLGPDPEGVAALFSWLKDWAGIYDAHAAVFAEFPGIGTSRGLAIGDVRAEAATFTSQVEARLRTADLRGLHPYDATAALTRITHMVHVYRSRAMFPLPATGIYESLTLALQLMLFPDTPERTFREVLRALRPARSPMLQSKADAQHDRPIPDVSLGPTSPVRQAVLRTSSALFAESGYHAVGMTDIAASANISRATLYRYYSTKHTILAELTQRAVSDVERLAGTLTRGGIGALTEWIADYVRFQRQARGVTRAWFDGTVATQLCEAPVRHGVSAIYGAAKGLLDTVDLPAGMDLDVAAVVFLAVLGRMTEPTFVGGAECDARAARLMMDLLTRSILRSVPRPL
ncbi:TetR/AcrR family transcriptional regulator [Mycobacterium vicinigordonae]|uniref:TetR/AcrR family transcriptional regulator n=1 Tax=Mycobacterium vicinigordonae TaxID=1719132 RepID=A0A7D6IAZ7_9MYCO|nr:TetR/AcrR family transcriptional regulator [Mycobacterium vicinigordonae]QLL10116.1 TetR/AcrR family transcriptional regulator [Mycobacterium vicinigordonae]